MVVDGKSNEVVGGGKSVEVVLSEFGVVSES